jgi:hypothetical protein
MGIEQSIQRIGTLLPFHAAKGYGHACWRAPQAAVVIDDLMAKNASKPGAQAGGPGKPIPLTPSCHQGVLSKVLRVLQGTYPQRGECH